VSEIDIETRPASRLPCTSALAFFKRVVVWKFAPGKTSKNAGRCWKSHQETDQDRAHVREIACARP
jgi:hypothetical protein